WCQQGCSRPCTPTATGKSWCPQGAHRMKINVSAAAAALLAATLAWPAAGQPAVTVPADGATTGSAADQANAADAPAQLRQFIATVPSATGRFTQQRADNRGQGKPVQSGEF